MPKAAGSAELKKVLARLASDSFRIAPRPEGTAVLDRLLALVMQGDGSYASADKALKALRAAFTNWSEMRVARHYEVVDALRRKRVASPVQRAELAQELLRRVFGLQNHLDLDWMDDCTSERREKTLVALQMMPPLASLVLDFDACELPELPVTVEHKRLLSRLGKVASNPKDADVAAILAEFGSPEEAFPLDLGLRLHARTVCDSKHPRCRQCCLLDLCPHGRKLLSSTSYRDALVELGLAKKPASTRKTAKKKVAKKAGKKQTRTPKDVVKKTVK